MKVSKETVVLRRWGYSTSIVRRLQVQPFCQKFAMEICCRIWNKLFYYSATQYYAKSCVVYFLRLWFNAFWISLRAIDMFLRKAWKNKLQSKIVSECFCEFLYWQVVHAGDRFIAFPVVFLRRRGKVDTYAGNLVRGKIQ